MKKTPQAAYTPKPDLGAVKNHMAHPKGGSGQGEEARPLPDGTKRFSPDELRIAYTLAVEREAAALRRFAEMVKSDPKWRDQAIEALKPQRRHE